MEKKVINIEDFFTTKNEEEGMWFEPSIEGIPCGIEFLVTGLHAEENVSKMEHFDKLQSDLSKIKDPIERAKERKRLDAKRVASLVKGIRATEDCEINFEGKPLEFSIPLIEELFYQSPLIKLAVADYSLKVVNFMNRKKILHS